MLKNFHSYSCDEYVVNDAICRIIEKIQQGRFQKNEVENEDGSYDKSDAELDLEEERDKDEDNWSKRESTSPRSLHKDDVNDVSDDLWKTEIVHNLRPRTARKRLHSFDGSSCQDKRPATKRRTSNNGKITKDKKVVGLRNLGNTCFMNAVLQSFNNISHFCEYLTQMPCLEGVAFDEPPQHRGRIVTSGRAAKELNLTDALLAEELRKVLLGLSLGGSNGQQAISPECLFLVIWKVVPRFRGYQQQDAHEFLTYMLDRLHTELLQLLPRVGHEPLGLRGKQSIVTAVFGGTLLSVVSCSKIENNNNNFLTGV